MKKGGNYRYRYTVKAEIFVGLKFRGFVSKPDFVGINFRGF